MNYLIGVDVDASATRTVLFDENGTVIASASRGYPLYQPKNGWAGQKPEDWRDAVLIILKAAAEQSGVPAEEVKGIGISGQMHGLVMLDEEGEVIRPSTIWYGQRTGRGVEDMLEVVPRERWIKITANPPLTGWTAAKILWVRKYKPENYQRYRHILLLKDYTHYVFTGGFATEVSDVNGIQLLDVSGRCWSEEVLHALDVDESLLGTVYESCQVADTLLKAVANQTGLTADMRVVGGAGDSAAVAVGTGIVRDGTAFTTIRTSDVILAHGSEVSVDPKGRVYTCCYAAPGAWHIVGVTQGAGLSSKWFKSQFCQDYVEGAGIRSKDVYDLINEDAAGIAPGSGRLVYLPYLVGERAPRLDPDYRDASFGLSAVHTKKHILRMVMEGISYSLCDCNGILGEMGMEVTQMMACGGGGKNPAWRQVSVDLYQCTVKTARQDEGPALGVAVLVGVGCGIYPDVETACNRLINEKSSTDPVKSNAEIYAGYHRLYQHLYDSLKKGLKTLASLKGWAYRGERKNMKGPELSICGGQVPMIQEEATWK